ncbi:MAG TPA: hypothetical protein VND68_12865 [Chloroflexia bacterium]|nr:hypothetical protein [Chloroflexia bacterium]
MRVDETDKQVHRPEKSSRLKDFWSDHPLGISLIALSAVLAALVTVLQYLGIGPFKLGGDQTPAHPRVLELKLDTYRQSKSEEGVAITSPYTLPVRQDALVVVTGTYSTWEASWWSEKPACKGVPEPEPMYKSEVIVRPGANGPVGLDAEFMFASPGRSEFYCRLAEDAPIRSFTPFQISTDGRTWKTLTSNYNSDHVYSYSVKGEGVPPRFRIADLIGPDDNYGVMLIYMELTSGP